MYMYTIFVKHKTKKSTLKQILTILVNCLKMSWSFNRHCGCSASLFSFSFFYHF